MEALVIYAASRESAEGFCSALSRLDATLVQGLDGRWQVEIPINGGNKEMLDALSAVEEYVSVRRDGPARLDLDGRRYTSPHRRDLVRTVRRRSRTLAEPSGL